MIRQWEYWYALESFRRGGQYMEQNEIYTQVVAIHNAIGMTDEDAERMMELVAE